jgi:hypothetical protein
MVRFLGKPAFLVALAFLPIQATQTPPTPSPTIPAPSPFSRVAAARFAMQNGWQFPKTKLVVAIDAFFGAVDGHPVRQSIVDQEKEALEIAKLLGPDVKTAFARSLLDCPNGRNPCYAKDVAVFVVSGMWEGNTPGAYVQLYLPGSKPGDPSTMTHAAIDLERRDGGWVGARYSLGPSTLTRRR